MGGMERQTPSTMMRTVMSTVLQRSRPETHDRPVNG